MAEQHREPLQERDLGEHERGADDGEVGQRGGQLGAARAGRPRAASGTITVPITNAAATPKIAIRVPVARRLPAMTPPSEIVAGAPPGRWPHHVEEERARVGRRRVVEHRVVGRHRQLRRRVAADDGGEPSVGRRQDRRREDREPARLAHGRRSARRPQTAARPTPAAWPRCGAPPRPGGGAAHAHRGRGAPHGQGQQPAGPDVRTGENQRDTLRTPVGVRRSRKMCHASRV